MELETLIRSVSIARCPLRRSFASVRRIVMKRIIIVLAALWGVAGCSTPTWETPEVDASETAWARNQMAATQASPSRQTQTDDLFEVARRVQERVTPAAYRVCTRMYSTGCEVVTNRPVRMDVHNREVNAYADTNNQVTLLGGLVRAVGSDDELAAVIAHEYAHVIIGHVHQMAGNAALGSLMGALAGTAIGVGLYTPGSTVIEDLGSTGFEVGASVGGLIYTLEMEREADHVGAYILHEAGYDLEAGRTLWIRLAREAQSGTRLGQRGLRGYFRTHPTTEMRYVAWEKAMQEIQSGQRRPFTRVEAVQLRQQELTQQRKEQLQRAFSSPDCKALQGRYPKCKWWKGKYDFGYLWRCPLPGKTKNWRACAGRRRIRLVR